jgi:hypothetical protein
MERSDILQPGEDTTTVRPNPTLKPPHAAPIQHQPWGGRHRLGRHLIKILEDEQELGQAQRRGKILYTV